MMFCNAVASVLACALAVRAPSADTYAENQEPTTKQSEAPVDASEGWSEFGFRARLRFGYERLFHDAPAPGASAFSINVEPGFRLSDLVSLGVGLRYSVVFGAWTGLRWNSTLDVAFHPTP